MTHRVLALMLIAAPVAAQQLAGAALPRGDIIALAHAQVAINVAHDSSNVQLAKPANKKADVQVQLKEKFRGVVDTILHHAGMTQAEYNRRTYMVSLDTAARRVYDSVVIVMTGAPLPGVMATAAKLVVPPGPAGVHIGHVVNGFGEAPSLMGLLPAAMAEARIAVQHAGLAGRQPENLIYMKTHAGHVIHALDPTIVTMGPGLGYGVKKAANGCATHIELAAKAEGATPAVTVHAVHIAMACRNTITRADAIIAVAQKIITATTAAEAAALVAQMAALSDQLIEGADANSDGRITWELNEGGLRHADEHAKLMLGVR